ncbi:MAG: hypothetical protein ACXABD_00640 [Candidatus Thorarchaeota archaeon]|jgi:hypothetical protein
MPNFKPKPIKKISGGNKTIITLDSKHDEMLDNFDSIDKELIPKLEAEKNELKDKFKVAKTIEEKLDLKDRIKSLKERIKDLKAGKKRYLLENSPQIFSYFEKKKEISEGNSKTKSLNAFFNKGEKENDMQETTINNDIQKYLQNIDNSYITLSNYVIDNDVCPYCKIGELVAIDHEGVQICRECSKTVTYLVENEKPSYKEPPKEVCFYAYKRINHFREILAQFQAKETTQIPDAVLENIRQQIKKERIEISQINNKKAKEILKKLGYNKYYEHIPFIKDKLGIRPPIMSPELEEMLCNLFMEIQGPYAKFCPDDRVNFLNYYYTVYKLCELLDQKEFLPYFPMLKDREKRIEQDEIWKKICQELDWQFIPTI